MTHCITFGKCNRYVKYIFLSAFFLFLTNLLYGFKFNNNFGNIGIFLTNNNNTNSTNTQDILFVHSSIHDIFRYFGVIILSLIFYICQRNRMKNEKKNIINNVKVNNDYKVKFTLSSSKIILIHDSAKNAFDKKNISTKLIIFIMILWVVQKFLSDIYYKCELRDLDYWMFELVIVSTINSILFNTKIYKHQNLSIYCNTIVCSILKLTSFTISSLFIAEDKNQYENHLWLVPIGITGYFVIMFLRSYVNSEIKVFMDLKYISPFKLLILYGVVGFFISTIISIVSTFFDCNQKLNFLCNVKRGEFIYFENFLKYFETFKNIKNNTSTKLKEIGIEVIVNIFGSISYFLYILFYVLIIQNLTPIHIIFTNTIYYLMLQSYYFIFDSQALLKDIKNNPILIKHIIDIAEDFIAMIGFLINLEFIELNCYGLNYNLRKNISERSIEDINEKFNDSGLIKDEEYLERSESSFSSEKASKSSRASGISNKN